MLTVTPLSCRQARWRVTQGWRTGSRNAALPFFTRLGLSDNCLLPVLGYTYQLTSIDAQDARRVERTGSEVG